MTRKTAFALLAALSAALLFAESGAAVAAACANGAYHAGCVGPNGAATVNKSTGEVHGATTSSAPKCANGVYHAGCVGPNGAATVNKSTGEVHTTGGTATQCRWVNGRRICN